MEQVLVLIAGIVQVVATVGGNVISMATVGLLYTVQHAAARVLKTLTGGFVDRVLASLCGEVRLN